MRHHADLPLKTEYQVAAQQFKVYSFAVIEEDVQIGLGSVIGSCVFVGRLATLGNNVHIQHGAFIARMSEIGNDVFIGPNAVLTDDKHPKAGQGYTPKPPVLEDGCSIGAGAVIMPGVAIGKNAVVGAGAVVMKNVPADATVVGAPARELNHFM